MDQHDDSCGQILLSFSLGQPEREVKSTIASFNAEFTATVYQQLPEDSPSYLILPPSVCCNNTTIYIYFLLYIGTYYQSHTRVPWPMEMMKLKNNLCFHNLTCAMH